MVRSVLVAVAGVWLVSGCIPRPPEPVYAVRRSALVSHPAPPARTGMPLAGAGQFELHDSTVAVPIPPSESPNANAGLYVARHNFGGGIRLRATENFDVGLRVETALLRGAMPIARDAAAPPNGTVLSFGLSLHYSAMLTDKFRLGFASDLFLSVNPVREEARCIRNCSGAPSSYFEHTDHTIGIASFSLLPSYRLGKIVLFGGVTWRNHPTNTKHQTQTISANRYDDADELDSGPAYILLGGGIEVEVASHVKLLGQLYQPVSTDVARYGPVVGVGVSFYFDAPPARNRPPLPYEPGRHP